MDDQGKTIVLVITVLGNFMSAAVYFLHVPFFHAEAERKGVRSAETGLVIGIYGLTTLISSPLIGSNLSVIGAKFCNCTGLLTAAITCILFGTLSFAKSLSSFLYLAYVIRLFESVGQCAFTISSLAVISVVYPESANNKMAMSVSAFTVGMIVGPTMGGLLYSVGGFGFPFVTVGGILLFLSIFSVIFMPNITSKEKPAKSEAYSLLNQPGVWLGMFSIFTTSVCIGYLEATIEPQLKRFHYSRFYARIFFIFSLAALCFFIRVAGHFADKVVNPKVVMTVGAVFMMASFGLIGVLPWTPYESKVILIAIVFICGCFGISFQLTPGFGEMLRISNSLRLPKNENTIGIISALYQMSTSLGILFGSVLGGILSDFVGLMKGSVLPVSFNILLLVMGWSAVCKHGKTSSRQYPEELNDTMWSNNEESVRLIK